MGRKGGRGSPQKQILKWASGGVREATQGKDSSEKEASQRGKDSLSGNRIRGADRSQAAGGPERPRHRRYWTAEREASFRAKEEEPGGRYFPFQLSSRKKALMASPPDGVPGRDLKGLKCKKRGTHEKKRPQKKTKQPSSTHKTVNQVRNTAPVLSPSSGQKRKEEILWASSTTLRSLPQAESTISRQSQEEKKLASRKKTEKRTFTWWPRGVISELPLEPTLRD